MSPIPEPALTPPLSPPSSWPVQLVITQTSDWIRATETKASVTMTALAVLLGAISADAWRVQGLWATGGPANLWLLLTAILACGFAFTAAVIVVFPAATPTHANQFSWPWLASVDLADLAATTTDAGLEQAWSYAWTLARSTRFKQRWLRRAILAGALAVTAFLAWKTTTPVPHPG